MQPRLHPRPGRRAAAAAAAAPDLDTAAAAVTTRRDGRGGARATTRDPGPPAWAGLSPSLGAADRPGPACCQSRCPTVTVSDS
jgi:hypothetical protein